MPPVLPPAPRKSRTWLFVVLSLAGAALLVVGAGALFVLTAKEQPLSANDKAALLTVEDVALWMEDFTPDISLESFSKKKYLDGSYEIDYEFDDPSNEAAPYVMCSIAVEPKASDALTHSLQRCILIETVSSPRCSLQALAWSSCCR